MKPWLIKNWPLVLAVLLTVTTQVIYWQSKPILGNCYDCGEYQDLANFIARDPKNIISDFRPPLYPVFLILNGLATPNPRGDLNLYLSQSFILIISLVVFWQLLKKSDLPKSVSWIPLLLLAISPAFYSFTKFKLTETLNMFLLLVLITIALRLKEKLDTKDALLFSTVSVIATFVRFANSYLAIVMVFVICIYYIKKLFQSKNYLKILLILFLIITPQTLYSFANLHRNYYFGLTGETGTNLLGKLVQYRLIPKNDLAYPKIVAAVSGCTGTLISTDVFTCVWDFLPKNSFVSKYSVNNTYVDAFARKQIILNLPTYIIKSVPISFGSISKPADMYLILSQAQSFIFEIEKLLAAVTSIILVVWLILILPIFIALHLKDLLKPEFFIIILFTAVSFYYLAITGLAAINDYQRIVTPVIPLLYFLVTITTYKIFSNIKYKFPK